MPDAPEQPTPPPRSRLRWILRALVGQRVRPLWLFAGGAFALFAAFRAGLMIASRQFLGSAGAGDLARCFAVGLRYDAIPIAYTAIPLVLAGTLAPDLAFGKKWFRRLLTAYVTVALTGLLLLEILGAGFFLTLHTRMNWLALDYLDHFSEAAGHIAENYPVWIIPVAALVAGVGLFLLLGRVLWRGRRPAGPIWPRPIWATALTALCVLGARGSLGHHPLRLGAAYFSQNAMVSQLALSNCFTLVHALRSHLEDERTLTDDRPFPSVEEAGRVVREMLLQEADTPLDAPGNPLWRRTDTGRPQRDYNVVVIVMEGMAGGPVGALGHKPSATPELDRLAQQGLFCEQMYATDQRTSRGLVGILSGHPDLGGKSLVKRSRAQGHFLTLPGIFRRRGYRTLFLYGGEPDFDNMQGFFGAGGIEKFIGQRDLNAPPELISDWGTHDEVLFKKAHETFSGLGDRKFFAVILTVSNHEPWVVPTGRFDALPPDREKNRKHNAYRYADWALGRFFADAARAPYFRRTIFVLVADHGRKFDHARLFDIPGFHVPCVFLGPGIRPRRIATVAGQTDVAPTLLALLGGSYEHCFLGRNLLAVPPGRGFAFCRDDDRLAFVENRHALVLPPNRPPVLYDRHPTDPQPIRPDQIRPEQLDPLRPLAYLFLARQLYLRGTYRMPQKRQGVTTTQP